MTDLLENQVPKDLFVTERLNRRPPRRTDYLQEKRALQDLARQMVNHPADVLERLVALAMEITGSTSGGISLFEQPPQNMFRWHYVCGELERFNGATTPRNFSPCGVTLDRREPILTRHPERYYTWISDAGIVCPEVLLVPLYITGEQPLGTLWAVSEHEDFFDSGHARVLTELSSFAGMAIHMLQSERRLKDTLEQQEMLTAEMSHRINNLFALIDGMIRVTAKSAATPKDMAQNLTGRLRALAEANALVRRTFAAAPAKGANLAEIIRTVLRPHGDRCKIDGPSIALGEHAINGFALICHELATNAAKYGALRNDGGHVDIAWHDHANRLELVWQERNGPPIETAPTNIGFGSTLAKRTIVDKFNGTLTYDWQRQGLTVTLSIPAENLQR